MLFRSEGVEFENEDLYREKIAVIKENYFPKNAVSESVKGVQTQQTLVEDVEHQEPVMADDSTVSQYAKALSRAIKRA